MKLTDLPTPLPGEVRHTYDEILKGTDQEPEIEVRDLGRRYRMIVENERVRMQIDYKLTGRRWVWAASRLWVDGVQREIMHSPQHFYRLWHDPDGDGHERADPADDITIEPYPLEDAPPELRQFVETVTSRLAAHEDPVGLEFGRADGVPVIRVVTADGVLTVQLSKVGPVWLPTSYRLVKDGYNLTHSSGGTFEGALKVLLGDRTGPGAAPAGGPQVRGAHTAQRNTSVEVRKQSVMRI